MINTGYTYDPDESQRIENLAAQVSSIALMAAAARSEGHIGRFERILTGYALAEIGAKSDPQLPEYCPKCNRSRFAHPYGLPCGTYKASELVRWIKWIVDTAPA